MRMLKQILDFYINSSIHVALAVYSLSWITLKQFDVAYDESILYFIFYATITGYNFVKHFGLAKFHYRSLENWLKIIQIFSFFCFVLMCYYASNLQPKTLIYILGLGIVTFFYAIPFLPRRLFMDSNYNLRSIAGLKIYIIALVWAGVTVILPLVNNNHDISFDVFVVAIQRYLLVVVLILPFDIRDLQYDSLKLSTIPQRIGVKNTKFIGVLLLLVFFFLEFLKDELVANQIINLLILVFVAMLLIVFSNKEKGRYYSAFWVEGLPIFWLVLVLLFN